MTLSDLLVALSGNTDQYIKLVDGETELITFNAGGYEAVESDITARTVDKIVIVDPRTIKILLTATP